MSCASDDTGCVPQSKDDPSGGVAATLKCGDGLSKAFGAAIRSVIKCHKKMADLTLKADPARDDEACETFDAVKHKSAKEKLDAAIAKVAPICTSTQLSLAAAEESTLFASKSNALSLDAQAGAVYCDGTTNIDPAGAGGDDAGTIDTAALDAKDKLKCADTVGSELGKLAAAAIKCHIKLADSDFGAKDFDENVCEENDPAKGKAALQKYNAAMTKLHAVLTVGLQPHRPRGERPGPGRGGQPARLSMPVRRLDDDDHDQLHDDKHRRNLHTDRGRAGDPAHLQDQRHHRREAVHDQLVE